MSMFESLNLSKEKKPIRELVPNADPVAVDFIQKCLMFRPSKRMTAEEALKHPFVKRFHKPEEEPICVKDMTFPLDDNRKFEIKKYRDEIYKYIEKRTK